MYQALLSNGGSLQTYPSTAFNVGTGDFTVMAMVQSTSGGTAVARKGTADGAGNGGFLLVVDPDGSITFTTCDGLGYYQVVTGQTTVLDGDCHTIAGIRDGATLTVLLDGLPVPATASGSGQSPLNVDNDLPLTIGCTQQGSQPHNQFLGALMNVSIWRAALSGDQLVQAAFARVTGAEPNLAGYWTLDATSEDLSGNDNPASIVGPVTFRYCFDCVWAEAGNAYTLCQVTNMPEPKPPTQTVSLTREIAVPAGAPALAYAIMADQATPAFPAGAQVQLTDPQGVVYDTDQNTDTVFATTSGGQLWGLMVVDPQPGSWQVSVMAPASSAFQLTFHTVPSADVVATSRTALGPLFDGEGRARFAGAAFGGYWGVVAGVAVAAVVGVIAAAAALFLGPAAPPAALVVIGAFAGTSLIRLNAALPVIAESDSLPVATRQVVGMAGFTVAAGKMLLMDANTRSDPATRYIYNAREKYLYPAVTASTFNQVQTRLVGEQMIPAQVQAAMNVPNTLYVSAAGHGKRKWLTGYAVEIVLATEGSRKFTPAMVQGKIIHFFACHCGYLDMTEPGLGQAMVGAGAVAFFGYEVAFGIERDYPDEFCRPDIEIDLQLIQGKTCREAYDAAIGAYNRTIEGLRMQGKHFIAQALKANRDALVAPSTNAAYGNPEARLQITS